MDASKLFAINNDIAEPIESKFLDSYVDFESSSKLKDNIY